MTQTEKHKVTPKKKFSDHNKAVDLANTLIEEIKNFDKKESGNRRFGIEVELRKLDTLKLILENKKQDLNFGTAEFTAIEVEVNNKIESITKEIEGFSQNVQAHNSDSRPGNANTPSSVHDASANNNEKQNGSSKANKNSCFPKLFSRKGK